ncbi:O-methyltransferase [Neorhizobium alkalisoli]|uniref:O-methyltransferase n=1 Tax=Neorhizobium alkalisoli TaxID=528178 RepID=UPI000CF979C2|nr:class I SAM-dependent methyltransferase [Neorhizobium alkalisoli]
MNTLQSARVAPLVDRLFAEADTATSPIFRNVSGSERARLLKSKTEYLQLYSLMKDLWLPVSPETGRLLYMLVRSIRAKTVIEFGTSFGISTLFLASALRDNGGGHLITTEFEPSKLAKASEHLMEGGLIDLVEMREGDALNTLSVGLPNQVDLVLLDGAKPLYADILRLVENSLRPGALIIADNADLCPDYLEHVRTAEGKYLSVPIADDIELSIRL